MTTYSAAIVGASSNLKSPGKDFLLTVADHSEVTIPINAVFFFLVMRLMENGVMDPGWEFLSFT